MNRTEEKSKPWIGKKLSTSWSRSSFPGASSNCEISQNLAPITLWLSSFFEAEASFLASFRYSTTDWELFTAFSVFPTVRKNDKTSTKARKTKSPFLVLNFKIVVNKTNILPNYWWNIILVDNNLLKLIISNKNRI